MRMTARELLGEAFSRLVNPAVVNPNKGFFALNNAQEDLIAAMHEADVDWLHAQVLVDLVASQKQYAIPAEVSRIVRVLRLDFDDLEFPVVQVNKLQADRLLGMGGQGPTYREPFTYQILPGNILQLTEPPAADLTGGLKLYTQPYVVRLTGLDDVPTGIPDQIHEALVPRAVLRLSSMGHAISSPRDFDRYAAAIEEQLQRHLYPAHGERYQDIDDVQGTYEEVF